MQNGDQVPLNTAEGKKLLGIAIQNQKFRINLLNIEIYLKKIEKPASITLTDEKIESEN
jgi:hypothetical protein